MKLRTLALVAAAGCSFEHGRAGSGDAGGGSAGSDSGVDIDAAIPDVPPDAACVIGSLDLCAQTAPDGPLVLTGLFNTNNDTRCRTFTQPGGAAACLIYAETITINALAATGTRPLLVASRSPITIDGILDVSSRRGGQVGAAANDTSCTFARTPENDLGGAAGGAGGTFGGKGGDGGEGDQGDSLGADGSALAGLASNTSTRPAFARGGCRGQNGGDESGTGANGGAGASSGGAVWIASLGAVTITGTGGIRATGAGAAGGQVQAGGGGGGSGGMVVIEASSIMLGGPISANGGGGGEGGVRTGTAGNPISITGNPGADGTFGTTAATGGTGAHAAAGDGGAGGTGGGGGSGGSSETGAGGGGGGAGFIHLVGTVSGTGTVSPPAS